MALANYSDLKASLSDMLADSALDGFRDTFIDMAEAYFNRTLRHTAMEEEATLTTDSDGNAVLPADLLSIRSVRYAGSPSRELRPISMGGENRLSPYDTSGIPVWYSISGTTLRVTPIQNAASLTLTYFEKIPPLSDSVTTNWLLDLAPDAYLYRCLAEAYTWRQQFDVAAGFAGHVKMICDDLSGLDERARYGNSEMTLDTIQP